MKYFFTCTLLLLLTNYTLQAQKFEKGTKVVHLGGEIKTSAVIVLGADAELGLADNIGVGPGLWFLKRGSFTQFYGGLSGHYHFNEFLKIDIEKMDVFAGLGAGIIYTNYTYSLPDLTLTTHLQIGGRYYISEKLGVFGQLNICIRGIRSGFGAGVAFKI